MGGETAMKKVPKYPVLEGEMIKRGLSKEQLALELSISYRSLFNKIKGKTSFTWDEACKIQSTFFPDMSKDELFRVNAKSA